jgi:hypothetical protein
MMTYWCEWAPLIIYHKILFAHPTNMYIFDIVDVISIN